MRQICAYEVWIKRMAGRRGLGLDAGNVRGRPRHIRPRGGSADTIFDIWLLFLTSRVRDRETVVP